MLDRLRSRLGLNALAQGNFTRAEKYFRKAAAGNCAGARHNLAVALMAQGRDEEAEGILLADSEAPGPSFPRSVALADLSCRLGKRRQALAWYGRALEECASPREEKRLRFRRELCRGEESFGRARRAREELSRGRERLAAGAAEEALALFGRSVEKDPSLFEGWNEAGVIWLNRKKDPRRALTCFEKALEYSDLSPIRRNRDLARRSCAPGEEG